jgi:hypothetical protein
MFVVYEQIPVTAYGSVHTVPVQICFLLIRPSSKRRAGDGKVFSRFCRRTCSYSEPSVFTLHVLKRSIIPSTWLKFKMRILELSKNNEGRHQHAG